MKFKDFVSVLGEYDGGINRGVKIDDKFLDNVAFGDFDGKELENLDVEKLTSFEQICGKVVQRGDLPVDFLRLEGRKALYIELNHNVEKVEVNLEGVGYLCVKVVDGVSGVVEINGGDLNCCLIEGVVGVGSRLDLEMDVCESETVLVSRIQLEEKAVLNFRVADLEVENGYFDIKNFLIGRLAKADVEWVYNNDGNEKKNAYVSNYFQAKDCNGQIMVKGVQEEKSRVTFLGEINISLEGGGTDSYLKEDVMILDESAYVEAIPSLEIKTNDVKAGHGVAISKITEDKLFYLKSRGISDVVARKLVKQGFLRSGYENFENQDMIDRLDELVTK
jgi:hypothetical protein